MNMLFPDATPCPTAVPWASKETQFFFHCLSFQMTYLCLYVWSHQMSIRCHPVCLFLAMSLLVWIP